MVNISEFAKRLIEIMDYYEISAALLADKIEVQRSSISHLLSGRNKPSLEFVLKLLKAFPEIEFYWLLNGLGTFPKQEANIENPKNDKTPTLFSDVASKRIPPQRIENEIRKSSEVEIDRIVIFFKDGSFKDYTTG